MPPMTDGVKEGLALLCVALIGAALMVIGSGGTLGTIGGVIAAVAGIFGLGRIAWSLVAG